MVIIVVFENIFFDVQMSYVKVIWDVDLCDIFNFFKVLFFSFGCVWEKLFGCYEIELFIYCDFFVYFFFWLEDDCKCVLMLL